MTLIKDLTGKKFGRLTVIKRAENNKNGQVRWECFCDCDCTTTIIVVGKNLSSGNTKSCGCLQRERAGKSKIKTDITDKRFGKLVAIEYGKKNKNGQRMWKCQCDCGNICFVLFNHLNSGATKSCGCLNKQNTIKRCRKNIIDKTFNKLTVIKYSHTYNKKAYWICQCECENFITVSTSSLTTGRIRSCGCTKSHGNNKINKILKLLDIRFEREKRFNNCRNKRPLPFDFYLSDYNLCIEYQGQQHYNIIERSNFKPKNEKIFEQTQINDKIKKDYCNKNNIKLLEIKYIDYNNIEKIIKENVK